ncbi:hypothetical protein EIP91_006404 [Steccherinum ochraceum]|uniref:F-box domain-containing protein n=1 Tax=Steccherinum ochraceum TaxID=92696 RepID=A0A4R0R893_9APHY|nr:hypothetical protein EIP91_006404 [Steccherinum ochraceum]
MLALPQELVDLIMGCMDSDTLSTCTLLSRAFHNVASPHLFRSLVIDDASPTHDFDAFLYDLRANVIRGPAKLVKTLTLQGADWDSFDLSVVDVHAIFAILAELPSVHTLKLVDILVKRNHDRKKAPIPPRSLKSLELYRLVFDLSRRAEGEISEDDFASLAVNNNQHVLCSFIQMLDMLASVETLAMYDTETIHIHRRSHKWESEPDFAVSTARFLGRLVNSGVRIKHLVSQQGTMSHDVYLELLKTSGSLDDLQTMRISDTYQTMYSFLHDSLARDLTHLHLVVGRDQRYNVPAGTKQIDLDLAQYNRLITLRISTILCGRDYSKEEKKRELSDSLSRFAAVLETASHQAPDTVTAIEIDVIDCRKNPPPNDTSILLYTGVDWESADVALARRQNLQRISFAFLFYPGTYWNAFDRSEFSEMEMDAREVKHKAQIDLVKAKLPRVRRRNILTVAYDREAM